MTDTDVAASAGGADETAAGSRGTEDSTTEAGRNDTAVVTAVSAEVTAPTATDGAVVADAADPDDEDDEPDDVDESEGEDEGEDEDEEQASSSAGRRGRRSGGASLRRLEEEGEVAADYLEELLDITDLDGDIDIDVENGRASVAVLADPAGDRELRRLVGSRGEVLEALQELSRLAVQARTGERSRLMLDIAGFRAARRRALEDVAARACQEVQRGGQAVRLEPMTAFERKVVHDVVAGAGLRSESEGEDPSRRVVVFPVSS